MDLEAAQSAGKGQSFQKAYMILDQVYLQLQMTRSSLSSLQVHSSLSL